MSPAARSRATALALISTAPSPAPRNRDRRAERFKPMLAPSSSTLVTSRVRRSNDANSAVLDATIARPRFRSTYSSPNAPAQKSSCSVSNGDIVPLLGSAVLTRLHTHGPLRLDDPAHRWNRLVR